MPAFDASSMIYAWDNYPVDQFPSLWKWLESQVKSGHICMSDVAFNEVANKIPECAKFLKLHELNPVSTTNEILQEAFRIKNMLGIMNDNFHVKGVGENDLLIIAMAKIEGVELISNEALQKNKPDDIRKMKIPAVCALPGVAITCRSFLDYLKSTQQVFN